MTIFEPKAHALRVLSDSTTNPRSIAYDDVRLALEGELTRELFSCSLETELRDTAQSSEDVTEESITKQASLQSTRKNAKSDIGAYATKLDHQNVELLTEF